MTPILLQKNFGSTSEISEVEPKFFWSNKNVTNITKMFSGSHKSAFKIYRRHIYDHTRTHSNSRIRTDVFLKQYGCQFQLKFLQEAKNRHKKYIGDKIYDNPEPTKISEVEPKFFWHLYCFKRTSALLRKCSWVQEWS